MKRAGRILWIVTLSLLGLTILFGMIGTVLLYLCPSVVSTTPDTYVVEGGGVVCGSIALVGVFLAMGALAMHLLSFLRKKPMLAIGSVVMIFLAQVFFVAASTLLMEGYAEDSSLPMVAISGFVVAIAAGVVAEVAFDCSIPYLVLYNIGLKREKNGADPEQRIHAKRLSAIRKLRMLYNAGRLSEEEYELRKLVLCKRYGISKEEADGEPAPQAEDPYDLDGKNE